MIHYFNREISEETVTLMIQDLNSCPRTEILDIYLDSVGGKVGIAGMFLDILRENKDRVRLVGSNALHSSAFRIFIMAECERRLVPGTYAIAHQGYADVQINEGGKPVNHFNRHTVELLQASERNQSEEYCRKAGFTAKEMKSFRAGEDLCILPERLKEMFEHSKLN